MYIIYHLDDSEDGIRYGWHYVTRNERMVHWVCMSSECVWMIPGTVNPED